MKNFLYTPAISLIMLASIALQAQGRVYYVNVAASGQHDGSNWMNAYTDVQAAIDAAANGDSIWVAAGTYLPTARFNGDTERNRTFYIDKDIALFGGFEGLSGTEGQFDLRDPGVHLTALSGDIGVAGDSVDNSFHVMVIDHVSDTMQLNGFHIRGGYNLDAGGFDGTGAGIFIIAEAGRSNPRIIRCDIADCHSVESGGAVHLYAGLGGTSTATFVNTLFQGSEGSGAGGIMLYVDDNGNMNPVFVNCQFKGNTARTAQGGAVSGIAHSANLAPQFINCIITGNKAPGNNAIDFFVTGTTNANPSFVNCTVAGNGDNALRASNIGTGNCALAIRNSIFWGNGPGTGVSVNGFAEDISNSLSPIGFFSGVGNLSGNPSFVLDPAAFITPHVFGDVHLQASSPVIDQGDNTAVPAGLILDADGGLRLVNSTGLDNAVVDMGAFEFQDIILASHDFIPGFKWSITPNPSTRFVNVNIASAGEYDVYLFNANGHALRTWSMTGDDTKPIDVSDLAQGNYTIVIKQDDRMAVGRFVKI